MSKAAWWIVAIVVVVGVIYFVTKGDTTVDTGGTPTGQEAGQGSFATE